jgi:hypothetical protein
MSDRFQTIPIVYDVARALGDLIDAWMSEYLAAIERQAPDLTPGDLERPVAAKIRHAGIWRRGEQTPAIVVWPEGVIEPQYDPEGSRWGTVQLAVLVVAAGPNEDATTLLAQRYAAAVDSLLDQRPVAVDRDGQPHLHRLLVHDIDYTALDVAERGRVRAGITLGYHAPGVYLGNRHGGPPPGADPRPDPTEPWPTAPTIELPAHVEVEPIDPDALLFPPTSDEDSP